MLDNLKESVFILNEKRERVVFLNKAAKRFEIELGQNFSMRVPGKAGDSFDRKKKAFTRIDHAHIFPSKSN